MGRPRKVAVAPAPEAVEASSDVVLIECLVANIFTHDAYILRGELAEIPASDLPIYGERVRVV